MAWQPALIHSRPCGSQVLENLEIDEQEIRKGVRVQGGQGELHEV